MARYSQAIKDEVRKLYVFDGMDLTAVSKKMKVPYVTVCRWKSEAEKKGDNWDKVKSAHLMVGGDIEDLSRQLLTEFAVQYKSTMDLVKESVELPATEKVQLLASLADSYIKTVNANKKLMPETSKLAVALEVLEMLAKFIQSHKPDLLLDFMEVLEAFGEQIERELK